MKKIMLAIGALLISASSFADTYYLVTIKDSGVLDGKSYCRTVLLTFNTSEYTISKDGLSLTTVKGSTIKGTVLDLQK